MADVELAIDRLNYIELDWKDAIFILTRLIGRATTDSRTLYITVSEKKPIFVGDK